MARPRGMARRLASPSSQNQAIGQFGFGFQAPEEPELLQLHRQMARVLGQVGGHQQFHSFLTDHLVTRGVPPPGDVGIDRYLSGGTGSRGNAHQVHRGAAALFLNVLNRPLA